ncbi:MAG: cobalt-precorrin-5B (C(1))-methyltransferase CbiD [Coriobacteriales bacterium]|nr:cobalt-precorrin-5B (C(1))-methyltransferase CbiD [Coriobacteriales bacterium]
MQRLDEYVHAGGKLLRCGCTTGTCAAAATRAAADLLLGGTCLPAVVVQTPAGIDVLVDIEEAQEGAGWACCAVQKDAGDDPDVTDGVMVYARVSCADEQGVAIDGGVGVGRVTKAGLDQPVGAAAINSVPRRMICGAARASARQHSYDGGLAVEISIPAGVELAERTFNPRLGIEGGISVLGTSGIVRPMSEDALVASIAAELSVLRATGADHVLVVPGNYGRDYAQDVLGLDVRQAVTCSNYLGATIDEAARLGFLSMLVVGHLGKMVKVAGGIMNTHSRVADCRAEVFAAHAAMAGASQDVVQAIMEASTTDAMVAIVHEAGVLDQTMQSLMARLRRVLAQRAGGALCVDAVVFSNKYGLLGASIGGIS